MGRLDPYPRRRHCWGMVYDIAITLNDWCMGNDGRLDAARAWSVWEAATSFLHQDPQFMQSHEDPAFALAFARIECHYFVNGGFFEVEHQLLRDAHRLHGIPGVIVHGRYDVVCPLANAWDLHKAWPQARLEITPTSGHSGFEAENVDALVRATDGFR